MDVSRDVKIFVNARAIRALKSDFGDHCTDLLTDFFDQLLSSIRAGDNDRAFNILSRLKEPNETHLGLSKGDSDGRALGPKKVEKLWRAFRNSKAVKSGLLTDLEDTVLLIEGISGDILSDIITNIIRGPLIGYTQEMCKNYGIPLENGVVSGSVWNMKTKDWDDELVSLPIADHKKLLLVPKSIVRLNSDYNVGVYYRNYIIPHLKTEEIKKGSDLVKTLKSGKSKGIKKVYKTDLEAKYGLTQKAASINLSSKNPKMFQEYKAANSGVQPALSHNILAGALDIDPPNWEELLNAVTSLVPGKKAAYQFEDAVENLLNALFHPALVDPQVQTPVHNGMKRVDITYTNYAQSGFFRWLATNYSAPYVYVECKNFGNEIGNPELDQLAMRFSESRGKFGMLICRNIEDRAKIEQSCRNILNNDKKYIIVLDDSDISQLVVEAKSAAIISEYNFPHLRNAFKRLVH